METNDTLYSALEEGIKLGLVDMFKKILSIKEVLSRQQAEGLLLLASEKKQWTTVEKILECTLSKDVKGEALWQAILANTDDSIQLAKKLLDHGANPNIKPKYSSTTTSLGLAVANGKSNLAKLLLAKKACPNERPYDLTPLQLAVRYGNIKMFKLILKYGGDPNKQSRYGNDIFYYLADIAYTTGRRKSYTKDFRVEATLALVEHRRLLKKSTPCKSKHMGKEDILYSVLAEGVKLGLVNIFQRITSIKEVLSRQQAKGLLLLASEKKQWTTVEKILECTLSKDVKGEALWQAIRANTDDSIQLAKKLLNHGANPNIKPKYYSTTTSLGLAVANGKSNLAKLLLAKKACPNERPYDLTPLQLAVRYGNIKMFKLILKYGGDPKKQSRYGNDIFYYLADILYAKDRRKFRVEATLALVEHRKWVKKISSDVVCAQTKMNDHSKKLKDFLEVSSDLSTILHSITRINKVLDKSVREKYNKAVADIKRSSSSPYVKQTNKKIQKRLDDLLRLSKMLKNSANWHEMYQVKRDDRNNDSLIRSFKLLDEREAVEISDTRQMIEAATTKLTKLLELASIYNKIAQTNAGVNRLWQSEVSEVVTALKEKAKRIFNTVDLSKPQEIKSASAQLRSCSKKLTTYLNWSTSYQNSAQKILSISRRLGQTAVGKLTPAIKSIFDSVDLSSTQPNRQAATTKLTELSGLVVIYNTIAQTNVGENRLWQSEVSEIVTARKEEAKYIFNTVDLSKPQEIKSASTQLQRCSKKLTTYLNWSISYQNEAQKMLSMSRCLGQTAVGKLTPAIKSIFDSVASSSTQPNREAATRRLSNILDLCTVFKNIEEIDNNSRIMRWVSVRKLKEQAKSIVNTLDFLLPENVIQVTTALNNLLEGFIKLDNFATKLLRCLDQYSSYMIMSATRRASVAKIKVGVMEAYKHCRSTGQAYAFWDFNRCRTQLINKVTAVLQETETHHRHSGAASIFGRRQPPSRLHELLGVSLQ